MDEKYIPLDSVLDAIAAQSCASSDEVEWTLGNLKDDVKKIPIVEVRPVIHAHWQSIEGVDGLERYYECSYCELNSVYLTELTPYCPDCGAVMDEKIDNVMHEEVDGTISECADAVKVEQRAQEANHYWIANGNVHTLYVVDKHGKNIPIVEIHDEQLHAAYNPLAPDVREAFNGFQKFRFILGCGRDIEERRKEFEIEYRRFLEWKSYSLFPWVRWKYGRMLTEWDGGAEP